MKDVGECLSSQHAKEKSERRQLFMKILQNIAFLAHQGLPLRGDGSEDDSNYIQLVGYSKLYLKLKLILLCSSDM